MTILRQSMTSRSSCLSFGQNAAGRSNCHEHLVSLIELFSFQILEGVEVTPIGEGLKDNDLLEWSMAVFCLQRRIIVLCNLVCRLRS
jgi:hypothetical protein